METIQQWWGVVDTYPQVLQVWNGCASLTIVVVTSNYNFHRRCSPQSILWGKILCWFCMDRWDCWRVLNFDPYPNMFPEEWFNPQLRTLPMGRLTTDEAENWVIYTNLLGDICRLFFMSKELEIIVDWPNQDHVFLSNSSPVWCRQDAHLSAMNLYYLQILV